VEKVPLNQAVQMVMEDSLPDAKTQVALLKYFAAQKKGTV
jgi:hypothetical protein